MQFSEERKWQRNGVTSWKVQLFEYLRSSPSSQTTIIGIDHCFSFSNTFMKCYDIGDWDHFLSDFCQHWLTHNHDNRVETLRQANPRTGNSDEFRLTEQWTSSAKSVFHFDIQGQVAMASHAVGPWLRFLRQNPQIKELIHFWPFDDFAEVYPSIFGKRYESEDRTGDEHDAYSIAMWLKQMDGQGYLERYFNPPLSSSERELPKLEGWILGVY
jgi:hypothetical protein